MKHPTRGVTTAGPCAPEPRVPDRTRYARIRRGVCEVCGETAAKCECDGPRELDFGDDTL